jgi:hypothetical protein
MAAALCDADGQGDGHHRSAVSTLPLSGPPQVEGYHSDYYRSTDQGADTAVSLQVLREDHQLQELVLR